MKKLFLVLLVIPILAHATPVSPYQAQRVAQNFINVSGEQVPSHQPLRLKRIAKQLTDNPQYYIFNNEDGGFVIVSGDDSATPILGYSTEGSIDIDNLPIQLEELLQAYSLEIQYAVENNLQATDSISALWNIYANSPQPQMATAVVNALIPTSWNQYPLYNALCPSDASLSSKGGHPTTGCVATAMAQIMKYWEYPQRGTGYKSYKSQHYGTLSVNFANTTYDWENMPLSLSSSTSSAQNNAVATLMYHCGVAVEMNYNSDGQGGSGANTLDWGGGRPSAETALKTYFGYASTLEGKQRSSMTASAWKTLLKAELDNHRPILYRGVSSQGGHAFICDGYDSNDNFHFNWGWGGQSNGFYSLTAGTSSSHNFTQDQCAVVGIKPKDGSGPAKNYDLFMNTDLDATNTSSSASSLDVNPYNFGNTLSFAAKIENNGTGTFNGTLKVAAFTNEGEFIAWSKESYHCSLGAGKVTERNTYTFDGGFPFIPGKYRAYMYYQDDDEQDSKLVKTDEGVLLTEYNNVAFTVRIPNGDLVCFSDFNVSYGSYTTGSDIVIDVDVRNSAILTAFYGQIKLSLYNADGTRAHIIEELDFSNGFPSSTTTSLSFHGCVDVEPGSYYLALTYKKSSETSWYFMRCMEKSPNPIPVTITAPHLRADVFEPNNSGKTATALLWEIDEEMEDFSTLQVSLHNSSDVDYYKLSFPLSRNYKINVSLFDKYHQGGQWYENADAQFAYSIGGNSFSAFYKGNGTISFTGPTTLYLLVKQYGLDGLGYYELSGEIEETSSEDIEDAYITQLKPTKLLRNGNVFILRGEKVYTLQGQKVRL